MCIMYNFTLGYVLDGFPSLCEDWLSMADQLDLVKNLPLTPDFIINLKVGTSSLDCHPCLVVVLFDPQIGTWSQKEQPPTSKQSDNLQANSCIWEMGQVAFEPGETEGVFDCRLDYQPLFKKVSPHSWSSSGKRGGSNTWSGRQRKSSLVLLKLFQNYNTPKFCYNSFTTTVLDHWNATCIINVFFSDQICICDE